MKKVNLLFLSLGLSLSLVGCSGNNKILKNITLSDFSETVLKDSVYTYDGKVTAKFTDNSTQDVTSECSYSTIDTSTLGEKTLKVSYTYNTDTVTKEASINVVDKVVFQKLEISNYLTTFVFNEVYDMKDLVVLAYFSNGTLGNVTDEAVISNIDTSTHGAKELTASYTFEGVTKTDTVTISEEVAEVKVTGVSLDVIEKEIEVGQSFTLNETVSPSNATNKQVSWSSNNVAVATVTSGVVKGLKVGTATIKVTTNDGNKTASCAVTVKQNQQSDEITPEAAIDIIEELGENVVSSKEYYVRGITSNVELDSNGFNGSFLNTNLKFRSVKGNGLATKVDDIAGKEVVIFGYLECYNGIYQIPYLPATASPTGQKYNAKLTYVNSGSTETIEPTNISISPVNKTLAIGDTCVLSPTVLPENATDKTVSWSSSNTSICTVTSSGTVTAKAKGNAVITAKTSNNLTATCNITVEQSGVTPIEGDEYKISFNKFESDGQTELTTSTILEQVESGSNFISSFSNLKKVYKGTGGLKLGSTNINGYFTVNLANNFAQLDCREIILGVGMYGTKGSTITINCNGTDVGTGSSSSGTISVKFNNPQKVTSVKVAASGRAYISDITLLCGEVVPVPVTSISIPSSKSISTGNSETLSVTYTPANANTGKSITWTSSNTTVATVSQNGVVEAKTPGTSNITARSEGGFTSVCLVTVANVAVSGVSISSTSETLKVGATKQLSATVSPSNATNKNVIWSSDNSTVASVDTSGLVTAKAVGTATITVKSVDGNKTASCSVNVEETKGDAWTIMIYMCGADLESENGLATGDIKEILNVKNQPSDVNILIETGGSNAWSLGSTYIQGASSISTSKLNRWHVENRKIVFDQELSYSSMGSSSTLQSYLEWGLTEYPADKVGVIFWNHGGAMYGCCYDEKKNDDSLTNSEMKSAFKNALANTGNSKLEFVGYDTCLTQVQDIADFNSEYFNYMIASEESESGYGWDYDTWVDDLYAKKSTENILKAIVDGFIADNGGASSTRSDQTLSYLDLSKMAAYRSAFESFASALKTQLSNKSVSKGTFASWMDKNVKAFAVDAESSETYFCLFDVKDMLNKISSNATYNPGSSYLNDVYTAFSDLVKYSVAQKGAGNAYGLGCIYAQGSSDSYYIKQAYTSTQTNFTNWMSFLKSYSYLG